MRPLPTVIIGLLLAGAALACSDSVPAPGATLSGTIWIDANANGLRDKCDPPGASASPRLELRAGDGQVREVKADRDGNFTFTDVPRGKYELTVQQRGGFQWPVTAPRDDGARAGYALELRGFEELEGLDFGVVGHDPLKIYPDGYGLFVVLFDDADADGELDVGECTLKQPWGVWVSAGGEGWSSSVGELSIYKFDSLRKPPGNVRVGYWINEISGAPPGTLRPTRADASGCPEPAEAVHIPGSRLYKSLIAIRTAEPGTATIRSRVFIDLDMDGVRDDGEPSVHPRSPSTHVAIKGDCDDGPQFGPQFASAPSGDGTYTFAAVPDGHWRVQLDTTALFPETTLEPVSTTPETVELDVREHDDLSTEFGVSYPRAAFVRVLAVSDDNLNGTADPGEPPFPGATVCYGQRQADESMFCPFATSADGSVIIGPLHPGTQFLSVIHPMGRGRVSEFTPVTVDEGETASIVIAVAP